MGMQFIPRDLLLAKTQNEKKVANCFFEASYLVRSSFEKVSRHWSYLTRRSEVPTYESFFFIQMGAKKRHEMFMFLGKLYFLFYSTVFLFIDPK